MRKLLVFIVLTVAALSLAACQPTPEEIVVRGKNLESMIEMATTEQPDSEPSDENSSLEEKIDAPEIYESELSDAMGKVSIHVNAQVNIPQYNKISVQRVKRGSFSQQQVDILFDRLIKGDPFSGDIYEPSKDDLHGQILRIESDQVPVSLLNEHEKMEREYLLGELKTQLEDAPDVSVKSPVTSQLVPMDPDTDYATGEKLYALAMSQEGGYESLGVYNYADNAVNFMNYTSEKNAFAKSMGFFAEIQTGSQAASQEELSAVAELTISEDDALLQAEALIGALGLGNEMKCYSVDKMYGGTHGSNVFLNPRKCVWFLRYARNVNGIPVTYTVWDCMKAEEEAQSSPWSYEDITIAIDDRGIMGFSWRSPYDVTDTVTEDANLIPFEEVIQVFNTMSLAVNSWDGYSMGSPDLTSIEIDVNEIRLGLSRVTEKDKRDSGLLIPVWDFFGTVTYISKSDGQTKTLVDGPVPVLTVNAIDGSIINRSLGY